MAITSGVSMNGSDGGAIAGSPFVGQALVRGSRPTTTRRGDHTTGRGPFAAGSGQPSVSSCIAAPDALTCTRTNAHLPPRSSAASESLNSFGEVGQQRDLLRRHRHVDRRAVARVGDFVGARAGARVVVARRARRPDERKGEQGADECAPAAEGARRAHRTTPAHRPRSASSAPDDGSPSVGPRAGAPAGASAPSTR